MFNQKVDKLPNTITHLTFNDCFNQKVDNLPNTITHLTLGKLFNQRINKLLISRITHLEINNENIINNTTTNLFISLTHLTFGQNLSYLDNIINNLPKTMKMRGCKTSSHLV